MLQGLANFGIGTLAAGLDISTFDSRGVCDGWFGSDIRHRGAKFHRLSADAGRQGAGRVRSPNGASRLRLALGVVSHPARRSAVLTYHRCIEDYRLNPHPYQQEHTRHRNPSPADAETVEL